MFEVFTNTSQALSEGTAITFDRQKFSDCRVKLNGAGNTISISTPGRYLIHFDGVGGSDTADGVLSIQLYVNGVAQVCALTQNATPAASTGTALGFDTLIQVSNSCCCSNNSQTLQIIATSTAAATLTHANLVVIHL